MSAKLQLPRGGVRLRQARRPLPLPTLSWLIGGRRAFTPRSIAGLNVWFRAHDLALADAAAVASWSDVSGNGVVATQGTGANQPTFQTNELNGYPIVRFDGTNDFLSFTSPVTAVPWSAITVVKGVASGTARFLGTANSSCSLGLFGAGSTWGFFSDQAAAVHTIGGLVATWSAVSFVHAGNTVAQGWANQVTTGGVFDPNDAGPSGAGWALGAEAGGINPGNCDIAEVIIYNRNISDAERIKVENYLSEKYALGF